MNREQQDMAVALAAKKIRPDAIAATLTRRYQQVFTAL